MDPTNGKVRVDDTCKANEEPLTIEGEQGPAGPPGPQGEQGIQGEPGVAGSGGASIAQLQPLLAESFAVCALGAWDPFCLDKTQDLYEMVGFSLDPSDYPATATAVLEAVVVNFSASETEACIRLIASDGTPVPGSDACTVAPAGAPYEDPSWPGHVFYETTYTPITSVPVPLPAAGSYALDVMFMDPAADTHRMRLQTKHLVIDW